MTGGSRGLGEEIAEGLAEAGASLVVAAAVSFGWRPRWTGCARGFVCEGVGCDAADQASVERAVLRTVELRGRLDILVNNAGITWAARLPKTCPSISGTTCWIST